MYTLLLIIFLSIFPQIFFNITAIIIAFIIIINISVTSSEKDSSNGFTGAISALAGNNEARWTVAGEAARIIATDSALAVIQLTLVNVLASTAGLPHETWIALAFVAFFGVDALPVAADVRPQRALVHLGERLQLRAKPVVIVYN